MRDILRQPISALWELEECGAPPVASRGADPTVVKSKPRALSDIATAIWPKRMTRPEAIRVCWEQLGLTSRKALKEYRGLPRELRYLPGEKVKQSK
jgi:hypothetical protein